MPLTVELVSAERKVWSGEANFVVARTLDGELGILPGHISLLGVLAEGFTVRISGGEAGDGIEAAAHGGFLSVSNDVVTILTETAELSDEIDVERARAALERATTAGDAATTIRPSPPLRGRERDSRPPASPSDGSRAGAPTMRAVLDFLDGAGWFVLLLGLLVLTWMLRRSLLGRRGATLHCGLRLDGCAPAQVVANQRLAHRDRPLHPGRPSSGSRC